MYIVQEMTLKERFIYRLGLSRSNIGTRFRLNISQIMNIGCTIGHKEDFFFYNIILSLIY